MKACDFAERVEESCSKVLEVMYFASINQVRHGTACCAAETPTDEIAFCLNFAGDVVGSFGVCMRLDVARGLAANFLGEDEVELGTEDVAEVVGELANMLCGSVVSHLESDSHFVLTHPEPTTQRPDESQDLLVTELMTDGGALTTWVIVGEATCQA